MNFRNLFDKNKEMITYNILTQNKYNDTNFLRSYNKIGIKKIINLYNDKTIINNTINITNEKLNTYVECIKQYEMNSIKLFNNYDFCYDSPKNFNRNIHFDDKVCQDYLYNKNFAIIKIKKILNTTYQNNILPKDFNPIIYKKINNDLTHLNNNEAGQHFIVSGMGEGRKYKENQEIIRPTYLQNYINKLNLSFKL